jgi:accessory gene regulator B
MKILRKYSYGTAKIIQEAAGHNHQRRYELYYGFKQIYSDLLKFIILIAASILLKSFVPTMLITISFAMLRHYTGGFHMKTSGQCFVVTVGLFIVAGTVISRLDLDTTVTTIFVLMSAVITYICIYKYAPRDCKSKLFKSQEEIKRLRRNSFKCFGIYVILEIVLILLNYNHAAASISTSCLLVVMAIIPITYNKFK